MKVAAIIVAGGRGERLGAAMPKQLLELGGRTILQRSLDAFTSSGLVHEVVVVLPAELVASGSVDLEYGGARVTVVAGGARRQDSVARGFETVSQDAEVVLVHDAARPLVTRDVIARTLAAAAGDGAAIAAVGARDTVKSTETRDGRPIVRATLPRDEIHLAQTPQGFRRAVLAEAIAVGVSGVEATDEAMLAEMAGHPVRLVEGDVGNVKITTEADLRLARAIVESERDEKGAAMAPRAVRIGFGYDLHRLVEGRPLVLGGVRIPYERGLAGHSDADAVCHAVTDALLGACALGDIGRLFPDTDPAWKDADSVALLQGAMARAREAGFEAVNIDVVVVAERPKIGPHVAAMRETLGRALQLDEGAISVKAKTNEGVDATGRGEAIAVHAVALVVRR